MDTSILLVGLATAAAFCISYYRQYKINCAKEANQKVLHAIKTQLYPFLLQDTNSKRKRKNIQRLKKMQLTEQEEKAYSEMLIQDDANWEAN